MSFSKRNRRIRQSPQIALSAVAEVVEPRVLLSVASVELLSTGAGADAVGMKELVIVAESYVSGYGTTQSLKIDEIRLVGNEVQVFSTTPSPHSWPGEFYPAYLETASVSVAPGAIASNSYRPAIAYILKSDPVSVTVPDREWKVVHFFSNIDQPRSDLYNLRTFGDSTLLYRRADADGDSGWMTTDIDPGAGSTVGLDFTPAPAVPMGLVSTSVSTTATSNTVTLWFDESPTSAFAEQRFVREYYISIQSNKLAFFIPLSTSLVAFDSQRFPMTDANGIGKTFGGSKTLNLPVDVYAWRVQVRDLPVFPDGTTGGNALATPWSEFSETARFAVLAPGEQIAVGRTYHDSSTAAATIEWGSVADASSYEVWINRVSDGAMVLHKTGLNGSSYRTDALDPDNYRVWVRATRTNGTRTSWSKFEELTVSVPYVSLPYFGTIHDSTPTIEWTTIPQSTQYRISFIDTAKEQMAQSIDFTSPEARQQFITAYTRTVQGSSSLHRVETPLPAGNFRIEVTLSFSNGTTTQGASYLKLEPSGVPIAVPNLDSLFSWAAEDDSVSYDVWVAYLGRPGATINVVPPKWKFDTQDGVTSGTYQLPADAPAGNYRIWIRPNMGSARQTKGAWSAPADFTSQGPLYRPLNITVDGEKLTWNPVPGVTRFRTTVYSANGVQILNSYTVRTDFAVPDNFIDGDYSVVVQAVDDNSQSFVNPPAVSVHHGGAPWTWNISNADNTFSWNDVPGVLSYTFLLYNLATNAEVFKYEGTATSTTLLNELPPGHYAARMYALRTLNERIVITDWARKDFDFGVVAPANIQLNGPVLSWDGSADARYSVTIGMKSGRFDAPNQFFQIPVDTIRIQPYPYFWFGNSPVQSTTIETSGNTVDLNSYITGLYSYDPSATLVVSVKTMVPNTGGTVGDILSAISDPVEFTLPQKPFWTDPILETATQPKPPAPTPIAGGENTILIPTFGALPSDVASKHLYRTENGAAIDLEYVKRYQLRLTDLQTGLVRTLNESQIPELLQLRDEFELPILNYGYRYGYDPIALDDVGFNGLTISLARQLQLPSSVYKIEARVQYLPVILSATTSDPYKFSLTDTQSDHINVAATPWSDWSTPLEYTMLPDGQNILPIANSAGTIAPRPTFAWGSNTLDAKYELWVENRTTKQRVIHETLRNVHQFKAMTDLPPGQYDWWVRIVGTTGTRNGWSFKQSLEVYAPAIATSVVAETADATPVVSWTAVTGAQSYVVTLTSTATGKVVYTGTAVASTRFHRVATTLPNDTYTVSIQAMLQNDARTAPGVADTRGGFVLKRMTVGVAPKITTFSPSKVTWQAVDGATRYDGWINYISPAGKMERILRQDAFGTEIQLPANLTSRAGEYRVWIRAIRNEAGQEYVGRWSDVKTLTVGSDSGSLNAGALTLVMSELATSGLPL